MKKYITVAALLTAGTAFASTGDTWTWIGSEGTLSLADWSTSSNWSASNSSYIPWIATNGDHWGTVTFSGNNEYSFSDTYSSSSENSSVQMWSSRLEVLNGAKLSLDMYKIQQSSVLVGDSSELSVSFAILNSNAQVIDFTVNGVLSLTNTTNPGAGTGGTNNGASFSIGTNGSVSFKYLLNGQPLSFEKTIDLGVGSTQIQTVEIATWESGEWDSSNHSLSMTATNAETMVEKDSLDKLSSVGDYFVSMTDGKLCVTYFSAVPEPSAFGMLAGLGALALVAARRRRK